MNNEEKNVMTIVTIARIVESTLWYCLNPREGSTFSYEERKARFSALNGLTSEGTPFALNCDNNGDAGKDLKQEMQYFIEDVYGEPGRIVTTTLDNKVVVEESLKIELFSTIVKLRGYLEGFLYAAKKALIEGNLLSKEFSDLIDEDVRYFHAFAGKISCIMISDKFKEINEIANNFAKSYSKQHGGIDPRKDPKFDVRDDPSYRMLENEFHQLNQDMLAVLNTYGENDEDFRFAREKIYSDCDIFTGKKQTTDINAFFSRFNSYLDKILDKTQNKLNQMFLDMGKAMQDKKEKEEEVKE